MRRLPIVVSIVVVVLDVSLLSARVIPGTAAQDATPAAQASQEMLGHGQLTCVPGYDRSSPASRSRQGRPSLPISTRGEPSSTSSPAP